MEQAPITIFERDETFDCNEPRIKRVLNDVNVLPDAIKMNGTLLERREEEYSDGICVRTYRPTETPKTEYGTVLNI